MIAGLERFVAQLRSEGVSASPAEWLDALRSVSALGLDDRERFRHALKCTLVKRASQHDLFDRLFDRFFAAPAWAGRKGRRRREGAGARAVAGPATAKRPAPGMRRHGPSTARDLTNRSGPATRNGKHWRAV